MFRDAEPTELCRECRAIATTTCPRCDGPCCAAHAPSELKRRCHLCEQSYALATVAPQEALAVQTPRRLQVALIIASSMIANAVVGLVHVIAGGELRRLIGPLVFASFTLPILLNNRAQVAGMLRAGRGARQLRRARRRFLRERHVHALLPPAGPTSLLPALAAAAEPAPTGCADCGSTPRASCLRCDAPLCAAHQPPSADHRCTTCEWLYAKRTQGDRLTASLTGSPALHSISLFHARRRLRRTRRQFLRERHVRFQIKPTFDPDAHLAQPDDEVP